MNIDGLYEIANGRNIGTVKTLAPLSALLRALGLVLLGHLAIAGAPARAEPKGGPLGLPSRPNIVLLTIDTLRADHSSAYGYDRATTPVIDAMSRSGVRYVRAMSQASWTLPSLASIHTGLYPTEHGAVHYQKRVSDEASMVAEVLKAAGYRTIGVVGHDFAGSAYGMAQGFDVFDESGYGEPHDSATSQTLVETALAAVPRAKDQPFFLWIHFFDPHFNWLRHPEYHYADELAEKLAPGAPRQTVTFDFLGNMGRRRENRHLITPAFKDFVRAVYDEEIAHTDHWIGKLMTGISALGRGSKTVTLVTGDHGELFWERGKMFHEGASYQELVHVPLIISGPMDRALHGHQVSRTVELASLARTIVELAGVETHDFAGENLLLLPTGVEKPRLAFSEGSYAHHPGDRSRTVVYDGWKLMKRLGSNEYELYETRRDPGETRNLWATHRADVEEMRKLLVEALDRFEAERRAVLPSTDADLEPDEHERLKALGYVE